MEATAAVQNPRPLRRVGPRTPVGPGVLSLYTREGDSPKWPVPKIKTCFGHFMSVIFNGDYHLPIPWRPTRKGNISSMTLNDLFQPSAF